MTAIANDAHISGARSWTYQRSSSARAVGSCGIVVISHPFLAQTLAQT